MTLQEVIFKVLSTFLSAEGESHLALDDRWGISLTIAGIINKLQHLHSDRIQYSAPSRHY